MESTNFTVTPIKKSWITLNSVLVAVCMFCLIFLVGKAFNHTSAQSDEARKLELTQRIETLNEELKKTQDSWSLEDSKLKMTTEYVNQQKRLLEANADYIRAQIEDAEYQMNVLTFGEGVERILPSFR